MRIAKMSETNPAQPEVLNLVIKDKNVLYVAYMSFVTNGGLFIPTQRAFNFGATVSLILNLLDESEKYACLAKIVWITPKGAQGNRAPGIGVQFLGEEGKKLKAKIETYL